MHINDEANREANMWEDQDFKNMERIAKEMDVEIDVTVNGIDVYFPECGPDEDDSPLHFDDWHDALAYFVECEEEAVRQGLEDIDDQILRYAL